MKLYKTYLEDPSDNISESDEQLIEEMLLTESEIIPDLVAGCLLESEELAELYLDYLSEEDEEKKEKKGGKFKKYLKMAGKAALYGAAGYGAYKAGTAGTAYAKKKYAQHKVGTKGHDVQVPMAPEKKGVVQTFKDKRKAKKDYETWDASWKPGEPKVQSPMRPKSMKDPELQKYKKEKAQKAKAKKKATSAELKSQLKRIGSKNPAPTSA